MDMVHDQRNGTQEYVPDLHGWVRQVMDRDSDKRARKIANYVCNTPLAGREAAMQRVVAALAAHRSAYLHKGWSGGVALITRYLADCSLRLGDYTFLNVVYAPQVDVQMTAQQHTRLELMISYFQYVASSEEKTRHFCRVMFTDLAEQLAPALKQGHAGLRSFLDKQTPLMIAIIWESVYCPASESGPVKGWFTNLLRMFAQTEDEEAFGWLETIWWLLTYRSAEVRVYDQGRFELFLEHANLSLTEYIMGSFDPESPTVIIPRGMSGAFEKFISALDRHCGELRQAAVEWCRWFMWYEPQLRIDLRDMQQAVTERPSRLIRPDGLDCIDVGRLTVLRDLGIQQIRFYPNGSPWPAMEIGFTLRVFGRLNTEIRGQLSANGLQVSPVLYDGCLPEDRGRRAIVLEYLVWECLYRLVVNRESHVHHAGCPGNGQMRRWTGYAPHWVALPDGKKPSIRAIERCLKLYQFRPPDGHTFNKGCEATNPDQMVVVPPRLVLTDDLLTHSTY